MTKEQFVKLMEVIHKKDDRLNEIYKGLEKLFGKINGDFFKDTNLYPIIRVITEIVGDDSGWIDWYVYEKQWGERTELTVKDEADIELPSETLEDLWELIQNEKRE